MRSSWYVQALQPHTLLSVKGFIVHTICGVTAEGHMPVVTWENDQLLGDNGLRKQLSSCHFLGSIVRPGCQPRHDSKMLLLILPNEMGKVLSD